MTSDHDHKGAGSDEARARSVRARGAFPGRRDIWHHAEQAAADPAIEEWGGAHSHWRSRFEPAEPDVAATLAATYWRGRDGRRVVAIFLRAAGSELARFLGDRGLAAASMGALSGAVWDHDAPRARWCPVQTA